MKEIVIKLNKQPKTWAEGKRHYPPMETFPELDAQEGKLNIEDADDIVQSQPLEEFGDFEDKLKQFELENPDEITQMAKSQGPLRKDQEMPFDSPEPTEREKDPVYDFLLRVIHGEIPESDLKLHAKGNCNKCYGRGRAGYQKGPDGEFDIPVVCDCVIKKVKNGKVEI